MSPTNVFDISPFYPLLTFPSRNDKKFQQLEKHLSRAESRPSTKDNSHSAVKESSVVSINMHDELDKVLLEAKTPGFMRRETSLGNLRSRKMNTGFPQGFPERMRMNTIREKPKPKKSKKIEFDALEILDHELSTEEKSVCFHCAKMIEMFTMRYKAITFANSEMKASLDGLKLTKRVHWDKQDLVYLTFIYKSSEKR